MKISYRARRITCNYLKTYRKYDKKKTKRVLMFIWWREDKIYAPVQWKNNPLRRRVQKMRYFPRKLWEMELVLNQ